MRIKFIVAFLFLSSIITYAQTSKIDSLHLQFTKAKKPIQQVEILNLIAYDLRNYNLEEMYQLASKAKNISAKNLLIDGYAESDRIIGIFFYYKSDYSRALKHLENAIFLFKKIKNLDGIAKTFNNIGNIYRKQGKYTHAIENYLNSLSFANKSKNNHIKASTLGNIGLIHWKQENYYEALDYYQKSLELFEKLGDKKGISNSLNNMGIIYYFQNDLDKSLAYFFKSLEIDKTLKDSSGISYCYNNISEIYFYKKDYKRSIEFTQKALDMRKKHGDIAGVCSSYSSLVSIYIDIEDYQNALINSDSAMNIAVKHDLLELQKNTHNQLASINKSLGNFKEAYYHIEKYKSISDSLFNENNIRKIVKLESQYEIEKKEQENLLINQKKEELHIKEVAHQKLIRNYTLIALIVLCFIIAILIYNYLQKKKANKILDQQKSKIEDQNLQLTKLNFTQNRLTGIISHDLKAPISAFHSISNSLKTKFNILSRDEIYNYNNRMLNSALMLKFQLDNILNWSASQQNVNKINKEKLNLYILSYKSILTLQEFANQKLIDIENNIPENCEVIIDRRLFGIVLNNLLSNAIKFSSKKGKIILRTHQDSSNTMFSIVDFGVGMSKKDLHSLFKNEHSENQITSTENSETGLGLQISKDIIKSLGGKIYAKSELEIGTEIIIEIPL